MNNDNAMFGIFIVAILIIGILGIFNYYQKTNTNNYILINYIKDKNLDKYKTQDEINFLEEKENSFRIGVFGTIYEREDNMTVYGWCIEYNNSPVIGNAKVTIYSRENITFLNTTNMTQLYEDGKFYYNGIAPNKTGNYLVEFNCSRTSDGEWGLGYDEIEVPKSLDDLHNKINEINLSSENITNLINLVINYSKEINSTTFLIYNTTNEINNNILSLMNLLGAYPFSWTTEILGETLIGNQISFFTLVRGYTDIESVDCYLNSNYWGNNTMKFNNLEEKFIYSDYLNSSGEFNWSVDCYED